jgi:small-conductance mechanosensitive channel
MWFNEGQGVAALTSWFTDMNMWRTVGLAALRIVIILLVSRVLVWTIHKAIMVLIINRNPSRLRLQERRMLTVGKLLKNVASYVVHFIAILLVLSEFGINLGPLLAGAGVVGLAIGFGAQSLVKDIITGFFIILEDQFAVGDVIQTGNFKGTVEMIGLRATRLQSWTGEVYIIPNGSINEVTNFSLHNSLAIVDISVAYEEDMDRAAQVIRETVAKLDDDNLVKQPEVLGVQSLGPSEITLRVVAECLPNSQAIISRKLNAEIKRALDVEGIEIPYPKMVTYQKS